MGLELSTAIVLVKNEFFNKFYKTETIELDESKIFLTLFFEKAELMNFSLKNLFELKWN